MKQRHALFRTSSCRVSVYILVTLHFAAGSVITSDVRYLSKQEMTVIDLFNFIVIVGFLLSMAVQGWLRRTYAYWSRVRNSLDAPGVQVARHILDRHDLPHVPVTMQRGRLTDHYDPLKDIVRLSEPIYREHSVASAAVAAHETGHALQDFTEYGPMELRGRLLPIAQVGAQFGPWAAMLGWMMGSSTFLQLGFAMFAAALAFQLLSLPIEFDASRRAKVELEKMGFTSEQDREGARKVLFAAAMTYVAGAATAMGQLLLILVIAGRGLGRWFGRSSR